MDSVVPVRFFTCWPSADAPKFLFDLKKEETSIMRKHIILQHKPKTKNQIQTPKKMQGKQPVTNTWKPQLIFSDPKQFAIQFPDQSRPKMDQKQPVPMSWQSQLVQQAMINDQKQFGMEFPDQSQPLAQRKKEKKNNKNKKQNIDEDPLETLRKVYSTESDESE